MSIPLTTHKTGKKSRLCKQTIRNIDLYPQSINLTYKGEDTFKSIHGGFVSLIVAGLLTAMTIYKTRDMLLRNLSTVNKNTLVSISNSYTPPENLSAKNISFAFSIADFYGDNQFDDPRYGKLILESHKFKINNRTNGTVNRDFEKINIPYSKCEIGKNFFYKNEEEAKQYKVE